MSLTPYRTSNITPMFIIHIIPPCSRRVQTVNHVAGVDVRKSLGRQDLNVDSGRTAEMIL